MATLEISINCLCHVVPDPENQVVHVLLPATGHHHHHVARALNRNPMFPKEGLPLEGWVLRLGGPGASADTSLKPPTTPEKGDRIADLTHLAGKLSRELLVEGSDDAKRVSSRIELRAGKVKMVKAEADWVLGGEKVRMAHRVTWEIKNFTEDMLEWIPLGGNGGEPPFDAGDLHAERKVVKLDIYHVTRESLPPDEIGDLDEEAVRQHFRAFYHLYGIDNPDDNKLPRMVQNPFDDTDEPGAVPHHEHAHAGAAGLPAQAAERAASATREHCGETAVLAMANARVDHVNCPASTGRFAS